MERFQKINLTPGKIEIPKINIDNFFKKEDKNKIPEKYIINKNATILFWEDGTKTVIKRNSEDEYDKKLAFLIAYFQKYSGLSKTQANKYLDNLLDEDEKKIQNMLQDETVIDIISDVFGNVGKVFINISENMKGGANK